MIQGVSDMGRSTWTVHQGTQAGQGMRSTGSGMGHREHGVWDAGRGSKYMTQEQGPQGTGFDVRPRGTEGPFFMSVPGAPACGSRGQFSPLTKACLVCLLLSASLDAKEWECPRGLEPRVTPPTSSDRGQGLGPSSWLRKSLPGPKVPSVRSSCEPLLAGPEPGNFPLSRPPSCFPPWLPLRL